MSEPPTPLPLAEASQRLRGRPGRPRKAREFGHVPGTSRLEPPVKKAETLGTPDSQSIAPRLLDVNRAAEYLGVSTWTVRDLEAAGELPRVRLPLPGQREVRRLLFDRRDLDRLVERSKA